MHRRRISRRPTESVIEHSIWVQAEQGNQKLSKKYHPDINPDEAAHEKFIEVSKGTATLQELELKLRSI